MESINKYKYISVYNRDELIERGFKHSNKYSDKDEEYLFYLFPIVQYNNAVLIYGEIAISTVTNFVKINCYDSCRNSLYLPFYQEEITKPYYYINFQITKIFKEYFKKFKIRRYE